MDTAGASELVGVGRGGQAVDNPDPEQGVHHLVSRFVICAALLPPVAAAAQPLRSARLAGGVRAEVGSNLARAEQLLAGQQWNEAIATLRRVMEDSGQQLIDLPTTPPEFRRFLPVREYCQMRLVRLAEDGPAALQIYRQQVNPLAEVWLKEALADNNGSRLRQIVQDLFASSVGDDALLRLSELALERAEFGRARCYLEQISPSSRHRLPGGSQPLWLAFRGFRTASDWEGMKLLSTGGGDTLPVFPDTQLHAASIAARLVLTSILEGSRERAGVELEWLRRVHPEASGRIAGRRGSYVELLAKMLKRSQTWPPVRGSRDWTSFAVTDARTGKATRGVDLARKPVWSAALAETSRTDVAGSSPVTPDDLLSHFPLVYNETVVLADATRVRAIQLGSGKPAFPTAAGGDSGTVFEVETFAVETGDDPGSVHGVARFAPTVHDGRVFARLGASRTSVAAANQGRRLPPAVLVGLDLNTEGKVLKGFPIQPPRGWAFESAPVCGTEELHVALRRRMDAHVELAVASYDLQTGRLRRPPTAICFSTTLGSPDFAERTHNLLTLAEGRLFLNTNVGVVAALDARSGVVEWALQYPRTGIDPMFARVPPHYARHLNPCVYHRGLLMVAPQDSPHVFALEAASGQLLWTSLGERTRAVRHILGVVGDGLILSGKRVLRLDLYNGKIRSQFPSPSDRRTRGVGRGVIAGDRVYFPTHETLHVLGAHDLRPARQPINLSSMGVRGGNLFIARGTLLIATSKRLFAFNAFGVPQTGPLPEN